MHVIIGTYPQVSVIDDATISITPMQSRPTRCVKKYCATRTVQVDVSGDIKFSSWVCSPDSELPIVCDTHSLRIVRSE